MIAGLALSGGYQQDLGSERVESERVAERVKE